MPGLSTCKICSHPEAHRFIKGAKEGGKKGTGWNAAEANEAAKVFNFKFTRQTWYAHVAHLGSAEERVVEAARRASRPDLVPTRTTNATFLETIRDIAMTRALADPESVTVDQALKAVAILEGKKEKGQDSLAILVAVTIGDAPVYRVHSAAGTPPPDAVEGEYRETPKEISA